MNRVRIRTPKPLARRPYRARRAPQHHDTVTAVIDATPAPRSLVVLAGIAAAAVLLELVVGLAVIL